VTTETRLISAIPTLASLDIRRSVDFYCSRLGFTEVYADQGAYGIVSRDSVSIHLWACKERYIAENTSCRVLVTGVDDYYAKCDSFGIVHPNGRLETKPWGTREFGILDPDGNLVTFAERQGT